VDQELINASKERFSVEPGAALWLSSVTAELADGAVLLRAGAFDWLADVPPSLGGGSIAPTPTAYLLGAIAGSAVLTLHGVLGPEFGVQIVGVSVAASCHSDMRGLLGMDGASPGIRDLALAVTISSPEAEERLQPAYAAWLSRCPVYLGVSRPSAVVTRFVTVPATTAGEFRPMSG
jgi:uncharacterized OsmC-like protein